MKKTTIYITGLPGFKPALIANLGTDWTDVTQDMDHELLRFDLPRKMTSEDFKKLIGESVLIEHNLLFLYSMNS